MKLLNMFEYTISWKKRFKVIEKKIHIPSMRIDFFA